MRKRNYFWLAVPVIALICVLTLSKPAPPLTVRFSHYEVTNGVTLGFIVISNSSGQSAIFSGNRTRFFIVTTATEQGWSAEQAWLGPYGAEGGMGGGFALTVPVRVMTNADWRVKVRYGFARPAQRLPRLLQLFVPERFLSVSCDQSTWSPRMEKPQTF